MSSCCSELHTPTVSALTASTLCSEADFDSTANGKEPCAEGRNVVLENVPCKASATGLVAHLVHLGFGAAWCELWMPRDRGSGLNKGKAYLRFPDADTAERFLFVAEGTCLDGSTQELRAHPATCRGAFPRVEHKGTGFGPILLRRESL